MVFLGGSSIIEFGNFQGLWFHGTPLCTNGSVGYLMQRSVKMCFQKQKLHFSEENYLNYTKETQFACDHYTFS